jgi:hypothetical protein
MIRILTLVTPVALILAGCSEEVAEAPAPAPAETAAMMPEPEETLHPPDRDKFAERFAAACPAAPQISTAMCRSKGMGSRDFTCEYGLGDDEYMRNEAILTEVDGDWEVAEPEKVCAQGV